MCLARMHISGRKGTEISFALQLTLVMDNFREPHDARRRPFPFFRLGVMIPLFCSVCVGGIFISQHQLYYIAVIPASHFLT